MLLWLARLCQTSIAITLVAIDANPELWPVVPGLQELESSNTPEAQELAVKLPPYAMIGLC